MLEGAADGHIGQADGDGAEGVGIEVGVGLEDVDRRLGREGVALLDDLASDFARFGVVVGGDGERWSVRRSFDGSGDFRRWSRRGWFDGRVDEGGSRGIEFVGKDVSGDGGHSVGEVCCCRRKDLRERMETLRFFCPLLSCPEGANGFLWW